MRRDSSSRGIESLDAVWGDFLSYKYIDDDFFDREVVIVVLLFYKNMLLSLLDRTDDAIELSARIDAYIATLYHRSDYVHDQSLESIVEDISQASNIHSPVSAPVLHEILLGHTVWSDFYPQAQNVQATLGTLVHVLDTTTQEPTRLIVANTMRLYHIQRMLKALFILSHHTKIPLHFSSSLAEKIRTPIVRDCVMHIEKTNSLLPLFQLWQRIICYDFIDDEHEIKEFMHVVIVVYKNLACCMHHARNPLESQEVQLQDVLELYDQISALEISELLDLLDDVATQLDHISHVYEFNNPELSWTTWFKKYWWAIPVVVTWMYLTIVKHTDNNSAHKVA